eukprot:3934278-Rhodomonas_salina.1
MSEPAQAGLLAVMRYSESSSSQRQSHGRLRGTALTRSQASRHTPRTHSRATASSSSSSSFLQRAPSASPHSPPGSATLSQDRTWRTQPRTSL